MSPSSTCRPRTSPKKCLDCAMSFTAMPLNAFDVWSMRSTVRADSGQRPGVHGLVGVHVHGVQLEHPAQRLAAVAAGVLERLHRPALPLRAVHAGLAPTLDDAEEALADGIRDTPLAQALVGEREEVAQHQLVGRQLAEPGPVQPGVDAVAGGPAEVLLARGEAHLGPHRTV